VLQIRIDRILYRSILLEIVLVDNGILLGDRFLIGTRPALEIRLLVPLLDGIEHVVAMLAELHCVTCLDSVTFSSVFTNGVRARSVVALSHHHGEIL
jgi:hypothetical protein